MPTKIEWTHIPGTIGETWSPVTGCTPVSEGCKNCYARRMAQWLAGRFGYPEAPHHFNVTLHPDRLEQPLRWRKPRTVFVCSMGDLFHEDVPGGFLIKVFAAMALCPQHTFMVLTKRAYEMSVFLESKRQEIRHAWLSNALRYSIPHVKTRTLGWPIPNIWLGISAENQEALDKRTHWLLQTPAAVHFVNFEPLLGPVDISPYLPYNPVKTGERDGKTQRQRENRLSGREGRGTGGRQPGAHLESGLQARRQMVRGNTPDLLREAQSRTRHRGISSDTRDEEEEADYDLSSQASFSPLQRANSRRADNQPHQREEKGQSSREPGGCDVFGANDSRSPGPENWSGGKSVGREQPQEEADNKRGGRNTQTTISRRGSEENSCRFSCEFPNNIENRARRAALSWVMCGGESGPGARPMDPNWVRSLREQAIAASVPFFFKQWGAWLGMDYTGEQIAFDGPECFNWSGTPIPPFLPGEDIGEVHRFNERTGASRIGKHRAGRELDGRMWDEFPRRRYK